MSTCHIHQVPVITSVTAEITIKSTLTVCYQTITVTTEINWANTKRHTFINESVKYTHVMQSIMIDRQIDR